MCHKCVHARAWVTETPFGKSLRASGEGLRATGEPPSIRRASEHPERASEHPERASEHPEGGSTASTSTHGAAAGAARLSGQGDPALRPFPKSRRCPVHRAALQRVAKRSCQRGRGAGCGGNERGRASWSESVCSVERYMTRLHDRTGSNDSEARICRPGRLHAMVQLQSILIEQLPMARLCDALLSRVSLGGDVHTAQPGAQLYNPPARSRSRRPLAGAHRGRSCAGVRAGAARQSRARPGREGLRLMGWRQRLC